MNDRIVDEVQLEREIQSHFSIQADVDAVIAARIPVSRTAEATVFLTKKKQLYVYITGQSGLVLGDVKKIVGRMGIKAEAYVPPKGRPRYFDEIGAAKFQEMFPGRRAVSDADIAFYRTLAPYQPALVLASDVENGAIYRYDPDAISGWRRAVNFTYRRIRTS